MKELLFLFILTGCIFIGCEHRRFTFKKYIFALFQLVPIWVFGPDGICDDEKNVWLSAARSHMLIQPTSQSDGNYFFPSLTLEYYTKICCTGPLNDMDIKKKMHSRNVQPKGNAVSGNTFSK